MDELAILLCKFPKYVMFKTNIELLVSLPLVSGNLGQLLRFWHKSSALMPVLDTSS